MSNAINPNQMDVCNEKHKAKDACVNRKLKILVECMICPKCSLPINANNFEKHLAKHDLNSSLMPKTPKTAKQKKELKTKKKAKQQAKEAKKNAVKSSAVLRDNAGKSVIDWVSKINRSGEELRALYAGKELPQTATKIVSTEKIANPALNICCIICKVALKSVNLNKHYRIVHGVDTQLYQAQDSNIRNIIEEDFIPRWLRLFSEKGYSVAMVQAFRRDAKNNSISLSELTGFLDIVKPIRKKLAEPLQPLKNDPDKIEWFLSEELISKPRSLILKSFKKDIHTIGRDSQDQAIFRKAVSENYNYCCAITGDSIAVEACHIQTHTDHYDNSTDNGIMLSVGLHRLFDAGVMIICPETMTITFTQDCFYKKHLEGASVRQGKIPINKEKLSVKNLNTW